MNATGNLPPSGGRGSQHEVQKRTPAGWQPLPLTLGGRGVSESSDGADDHAACVALAIDGRLDGDWRVAVWEVPRDGRDPDGVAGVVDGIRFCEAEAR